MAGSRDAGGPAGQYLTVTDRTESIQNNESYVRAWHVPCTCWQSAMRACHMPQLSSRAPAPVSVPGQRAVGPRRTRADSDALPPRGLPVLQQARPAARAALLDGALLPHTRECSALVRGRAGICSSARGRVRVIVGTRNLARRGRLRRPRFSPPRPDSADSVVAAIRVAHLACANTRAARRDGLRRSLAAQTLLRGLAAAPSRRAVPMPARRGSRDRRPHAAPRCRAVPMPARSTGDRATQACCTTVGGAGQPSTTFSGPYIKGCAAPPSARAGPIPARGRGAVSTPQVAAAGAPRRLSRHPNAPRCRPRCCLQPPFAVARLSGPHITAWPGCQPRRGLQPSSRPAGRRRCRPPAAVIRAAAVAGAPAAWRKEVGVGICAGAGRGRAWRGRKGGRGWRRRRLYSSSRSDSSDGCGAAGARPARPVTVPRRLRATVTSLRVLARGPKQTDTAGEGRGGSRAAAAAGSRAGLWRMPRRAAGGGGVGARAPRAALGGAGAQRGRRPWACGMSGQAAKKPSQGRRGAGREEAASSQTDKAGERAGREEAAAAAQMRHGAPRRAGGCWKAAVARRGEGQSR